MTRYELIERIGVGGMAEVFRGKATAVGGFEKNVAIKKILPHLSQDDRFVRLLIAEAKLLAHLRQRNIVQVYDVGLGEDGGYFLVLEYVDGRDLASLFEKMERRRERFSVDLALHIGSEVCEALEHAHRAVDGQGRALALVHRDVSPSNVMLSASGEVKLTDFGIAKKGDGQSAVRQIAGKYAYMSPEQAEGGAVGPASDQYSLGVILWELLLGRRLYAGLPEVEALRHVREGRVTRPRELDQTFSRELEGIIMKALARDPRQRYASAGAFGAALRDHRYSAATAGDPPREIQALLRRHFQEGGARGAAASAEPSRVVRIETVAGFAPPAAPSGAAVGGGSAAGKGGGLAPGRRVVDEFEAPTVAATSAAIAAGSGVGVGPPPAVPAPGARKSASASAPPALPGFDAISDDAETRMMDMRRRPEPPPSRPPPAKAPPGTDRAREATPTIKEIPLAALRDGAVSSRPLPAPEVDLLGQNRRRLLITAAVLVVLLAVLGFVIATSLGGDDEAPPGRLAPPTGDPLEGPAIQAPVKKR